MGDVDIPSDMIITDVESPKILDQIRGLLFDTPTELCLFSKGVCFRFNKPSLPRIIKVEKLELNPDYYPAKIEMKQQDLFNFARKQALDVLETSEGYYIVSNTLVFLCSKEAKLEDSDPKPLHTYRSS